MLMQLGIHHNQCQAMESTSAFRCLRKNIIVHQINSHIR